jgi:glucosamine-6-phosphate deaminase
MNVLVANNYEEVSKIAADIITKLVVSKPNCILGLATGSTPIGTYKKLIEYNKEKMVDFSKVTSFNLDEYLGLPGDHPQSYRFFMNNNLFNHINIDINNTFVPNGIASDIQKECENYDQMILDAGGIDLQVLGIGNNGHIGFNEPSEVLNMGTHVTNLTENTIQANARFFNSIDEVPTKAITMGLGSIMKAKHIVLIASGSAKADIIGKLINGKIDTLIPASLLQVHHNVTVIVDKEAGAKIVNNSKLTKFQKHSAIEGLTNFSKMLTFAF